MWSSARRGGSTSVFPTVRWVATRSTALRSRSCPPRPATSGGSAVLERSSSRPCRCEPPPDRRGLQQRSAAVCSRAVRRGSPSGSATTSSMTLSEPSFVIDVSAHYETKRRALACHATPVQAVGSDAVATRLTSPTLPPAHRKPRRAVRRACRAWPLPKGWSCVSRSSRPDLFKTPGRAHEHRDHLLRVSRRQRRGRDGAWQGARHRGHQVHIISTEMPFRLGEFQAGLSFHQVLTPDVPAVPGAAVPAVAGEQGRAGRARVPPRRHPRALRGAARNGGAAREQVLSAVARHAPPRVVATLHGTDITLVGNDPSYSEIVAYLDRAVGRRDRGVRELAGVDASRAGRGARHRRDSQFPRLRCPSSHRRSETCAGVSPAVTRRSW